MQIVGAQCRGDGIQKKAPSEISSRRFVLLACKRCGLWVLGRSKGMFGRCGFWFDGSSLDADCGSKGTLIGGQPRTSGSRSGKRRKHIQRSSGPPLWFYANTYIPIYIYIYMYTYTYVYVHINIYIYMYACRYVGM